VWQYAAWQADRAAASRSLVDAVPVGLGEVIGPDDQFPGAESGQPVVVSGEWLPQSAILVSGRINQAATSGKLGYWVVTPLAVGGPDGAAFPVVIGWSATRDLPDLPSGAAELTAWLQAPEAVIEADPDPADNMVSSLRIADLVQRLDRDAYGGFGIATEPLAGLAAVEVSKSSGADWSTGARNLFYAVEWWFFGGFAVFAWSRYLRDEMAESRYPRDDPAVRFGSCATFIRRTASSP